MPEDLFIKNTPDDVADRLRKQAAAHDRSLEEELLAIVEAAASPASEILSPKAFLAMVREWGISSTESSVDFIRAERERDEFH